MTEPTPLSWDALIDQVPQLPVNPAITHDRGRSYRLERTRQLLEAVALTADAEMRERGLDPNVTPNPINRLLFRQVEHGLFDKIATAIERSANGNRFGNPLASPF